MVRYCPTGDGAFEDWVVDCPDCGQPLVDEPPAEDEPVRLRVEETGSGPVVYLATAPNEMIAGMWVEALQQEGIRAMIRPLGPGFGGWASSYNLEHTISVLESRLAEARDVIAAIEGIGFDEDEESPFDGPRR
ncbi:MAG: hypothetical protein ACRDJH_04655 [Thermomicrobiales bacterium]